MSDDTLAGLILAGAVVCLVLIAIGLLGSVLYADGLEAERQREQARDREVGR